MWWLIWFKFSSLLNSTWAVLVQGSYIGKKHDFYLESIEIYNNNKKWLLYFCVFISWDYKTQNLAEDGKFPKSSSHSNFSFFFLFFKVLFHKVKTFHIFHNMGLGAKWHFPHYAPSCPCSYSPSSFLIFTFIFLQWLTFSFLNSQRLDPLLGKNFSK